MHRSLFPSILLLCCALAIASTVEAAPRGLRILAYERVLLSDTSPTESPRKPAHSRTDRQIEFDAYGRRFSLALRRNPRVDALLAAGGAAYRGLAEDSRSWVRVTDTRSGLHGMIWDGSELYVIAPGEQIVDALVPPLEHPRGPIIFRLSDTLLPDAAASCFLEATAGARAKSGDAAYAELMDELDAAARTAQAGGAALAIELSVLADSRFARYSGSVDHARDEILARLNNVDGIFTAQLGLKFNIASLEVYAAGDDPFTTTTSPSSLLRELSEQRRRVATLRTTGLTHLFTGRDLEGDTVGVAYLDSVCDPELAAAITELRGRTTVYESLITAHEIGHNLGAPHDGEAGSCLSTPQTFLMAPRINGNETFSACSLGQINPRIEAAPCISSIASLDLTATAQSESVRALVDRESQVRFTVANEGGTTAFASRAFITTTGAGLVIRSASASQGTCTTNATQVTCDLADIAADSAANIEAIYAGDVPGDGTIAMAVAASSSDANAANDEAVVRVSVERGADLALSLAAPASVEVDREFAVKLDVENRATDGTTNPRVLTTLPSAFTVVAANLAGGTCTVAAASVTCTQSVLDAGRQLTISLALQASASGSYSLSAKATGDRLDLMPEDNEANAQLTAHGAASVAAPTGSGSGGGGAMAPVLALVLLGLALLRRRFS